MTRVRCAKWALLLAFALVSLWASQARAQRDRRLRFLTFETEHFRIHYHEPLGLVAREVAAEADAIHRRIAASLGLSLRQRVELVIRDDSDAANGFTRVLPYNAIELRVVAPEDLSALSDYDSYLRMLLTHEHTHVLHLEHASGLPGFAQFLFGRFYTPQAYLPSWFKEGLAVVEESEHTTGGRVRSTLFDMYLRMDALEDRVLDLDWLAFDGEPWPHGQVRYVYGQAFVGFIARRHGTRAIGEFIREYGRRLVPYGLNRALKRATGETFTELYRAFVSELRERAEHTRRRVEAEGRVEGVRLTHHGELARSPRFRSERELVYLVSDAREPPELRRLELASLEPRRILRVGSVGQVAPIPRTDRVVFSQTAYHRGVYAYSELFAVDGDGGRRRKLTHGVRAREPDVSPDGTRIAFVTHGAGTSHLEIAELRDIARTRRVVVQSRRLDQVFTPRWSPDGRTIAYGAQEYGGYRDLWLLDVASGARTRVTYDRAFDRGPVFAPDGKTLYFSSDRTGIANLYAFELASGALWQITNVLGGAFQPDVSPDGKRIAYVGYGSRGFDLYLLDLESATARPAAVAEERPPAPPRAEPLPLVSRSYQPLRSLAPRYYDLAFERSGSGLWLALNTSGSDAVELHRWSLRLSANFERYDRSMEAGYVNRIARMPLLLYGSFREVERSPGRSDLIVSNSGQRWRARESSFSIGTSLSLPQPMYSFTLRADYVGGVLAKAAPFDIPLDPNYPPPRLPALGYDAHTAASVSFSRTQRQPFDISTSFGQNVSVGATWREPYLGSSTRELGVSYRGEQFVRFDFRESVLAFAYTGAHHTWNVLGGLPSVLVPLRDVLLGSPASPSDYARLRGLRERRGENLACAQVEYRFLVSRINRGIETLPVFARRVHAALFVDAGDAYDGRFDVRRVGVGVGGELRLDFGSEYGADSRVRLGVAQGLTEGGLFSWYTTYARPF